MENLEWWDALRTPPPHALKLISGGRLSGKTDINPQWRMGIMTQTFGPCGVGWKYTIDKLWTEPTGGGQVAVFALVSLYVNDLESGWSDAIPGIGGNWLVEQEKAGLHANDEAYKMAVTDALSVAMKALGVAADVYEGSMDGSKYAKKPPQAPAALPQSAGVPAQGYKRSEPYRLGQGNKHGFAGMTFEEVWETGPEGEKYVRACAKSDKIDNEAIKLSAQAVVDAHREASDAE